MDISWEKRYQSGQTGWDRGETSANLLHWIKLELLKPCRILVPGCGNGYEVVTLAQQGFDVVAIDIAPSPLDNLRAMLDAKGLQAELIQTDFLQWQAERPFNAIYEQTSLCALQPELWSHYEQRLYNCLQQAGQLFAQFMQTDQEGGPPFHCDIAAMLSLFHSQRWQWSEQYETQVEHYSGKFEKLYCLQKNS